MEVAVYEIYMEQIFDLLAAPLPSARSLPSLANNKARREKLEVRLGGKEGVFVEGLTRTEVNSLDEVLAVLSRGHANRSTGETKANEHSSRSHLLRSCGFIRFFFRVCVFSHSRMYCRLLSIFVQGSNLVTGEQLRGKLHLVDLAGSERISQTNATGDR